MAAVIAVSLNKIPNVIVTVREGAKSIDKSFTSSFYLQGIAIKKKFFYSIYHNFILTLLPLREEA